ncbi:MAG: alpha-L-fucosidase, partial [Chloroflexi bacterium]|nr:alpha-L-fucosidase [Chloroflexota bacterium]
MKYTVFETKMGWMGVIGSARGLRRMTIPLPSPEEAFRDLEPDLGEADLDPGFFGGLAGRMQRFFEDGEAAFPDQFDTLNSEYAKLYGTPRAAEAPVNYDFIVDWFARTRELIDQFSPDVLYFDFGWHRDEFSPWHPRVLQYYYNHAKEHGYEPVLQYKQKIPEDLAVLDVERGKLAGIRERFWQTDTSVSYKSWCYIEDDEFRTVQSIIHDLVDIVSKNGSLLLNIGPRPDGTIPNEVRKLLLGVGEWLETNGEAIYETRPWESFGEGPTGIPE